MTTPDRLRIATRESPLALWQAEHIRDRLQALHPGLAVELCPMTTRGDQLLGQPLSQLGGKGLFLKELEQAMLAGTADLAVHSMKDVPADLPEGFVLAATCSREDPRDALVGDAAKDGLLGLPQGARVGTASLRRRAQLLALRPDLDTGVVRGNVQTRLGHLDAGRFDVLVLALAGLRRLDLEHRVAAVLPLEQSLPSGGQGALGIECLADATGVRTLLAGLDDANTGACVAAERTVCRALDAGCSAPLAAHCRATDAGYELVALAASIDGTRVLRARAAGPDADALGPEVAGQLLAQGADALLAEAAAAAAAGA